MLYSIFAILSCMQSFDALCVDVFMSYVCVSAFVI